MSVAFTSIERVGLTFLPEDSVVEVLDAWAKTISQGPFRIEKVSVGVYEKIGKATLIVSVEKTEA